MQTSRIPALYVKPESATPNGTDERGREKGRRCNDQRRCPAARSDAANAFVYQVARTARKGTRAAPLCARNVNAHGRHCLLSRRLPTLLRREICDTPSRRRPAPRGKAPPKKIRAHGCSQVAGQKQTHSCACESRPLSRSFGQSPSRSATQHNSQPDGGSKRQEQQCSRLLQRRPRFLERRQALSLSLWAKKQNRKRAFSGNVNAVRTGIGLRLKVLSRQRWKLRTCPGR